MRPAAHPAQAGRSAVAVLAALTVLLSFFSAVRAEDGVFEPLTIVTKTGRFPFQVEVMRSDEEHARGLMFRRSLEPDRGMLFDFHEEKPASFWMQNTYIPLDMLFIKADGTIHRIEKNTEPLSTRAIPSGAPVRAVLEVRGGTADRLGVRPGDRVEQAIFPAR
jgi:uncharacterized membrane protein (UPF0127 family)